MTVAVDYKQTFARHSSIDVGSKEWRRIKSGVHQRSADRLLSMCCANGGAYIKVGQHIGALEYLLPPEYVQTFKVLHSRAPQSSLADLFHVIREEFGREPEDIFLSFEPEPLGTASLAQVHRARLKDGREVAMKIQHPKVKRRSAVDITTMEFLVNCFCLVRPWGTWLFHLLEITGFHVSQCEAPASSYLNFRPSRFSPNSSSHGWRRRLVRIFLWNWTFSTRGAILKSWRFYLMTFLSSKFRGSIGTCRPTEC